jgi:mRNA interferase RelE/StbE
MLYKLEFLPSADREWKKLGATVRQQFQTKLQERLARPRVLKDALSDYPDHYKIKLRAAGYRLIYRVIDRTVTVMVVRIGKREHSKVYRNIPRD